MEEDTIYGAAIEGEVLLRFHRGGRSVVERCDISKLKPRSNAPGSAGVQLSGERERQLRLRLSKMQ
jgi:hypothetical protein